jgi:hypothetical protein
MTPPSLHGSGRCITVAVVGLVSALALSGASSDNREQNLAKCKLRAVQLYRPPADEGDWQAEPLAYVRTCMRAAGYWWDAESPDCSSMLDKTFFPRCWH